METDTQDGYSPVARAVFRYGLNYRWQEGKFITEENKPLFYTHIPAAFLTAFTLLEEAEKESETFGICKKSSLVCTMTRHTFAGTAFSKALKKRLTVRYLSCSRSLELRFMATDLCKYAENRVRRLIGVKSRMHTANLDPRMKAAADAYFAPLFAATEKKKKQARTQPPPEYEARYEAKSDPFSPEMRR